MKKPRYRTTAEREGFSWVLDSFVSGHVRRLWSAPSDNKTSWWLSVTGAQWDRVSNVWVYCPRKNSWARLFKTNDVVSKRFVKISNVNISYMPLFFATIFC